MRTNEEVRLVTPFKLDGPGSQKRMTVAGFPSEHGTGWRPARPELEVLCKETSHNFLLKENGT